MPKLFLYPDEWYPVWTLTEKTASRHARVIELSDDELSDLRRVEDEFMKWQEKLNDLYGPPEKS